MEDYIGCKDWTFGKLIAWQYKHLTDLPSATMHEEHQFVNCSSVNE